MVTKFEIDGCRMLARERDNSVSLYEVVGENELPEMEVDDSGKYTRRSRYASIYVPKHDVILTINWQDDEEFDRWDYVPLDAARWLEVPDDLKFGDEDGEMSTKVKNPEEYSQWNVSASTWSSNRAVEPMLEATDFLVLEQKKSGWGDDK